MKYFFYKHEFMYSIYLLEKEINLIKIYINQTIRTHWNQLNVDKIQQTHT